MSTASLRILVFLCTTLVLLDPLPSFGGFEREPLPLYIIERDTLQTRNFIPIVNHHTMVVNLGDYDLTLDVVSDIPSGKFQEGPAYPAFLEESLLPDPLFAPIDVSPVKTLHLDRPDIVTDNNTTAFVWRDIKLSPGEALISQYDNYYGETGMFRRKAGFDIERLAIKADYSVKREDETRWTISFAYTLHNRTERMIKDLSFGVFIPCEHLNEDGGTTPLFDLGEICVSPEIEFSRVTRADGFGNAAAGINVMHWRDAFAADAAISFSFKLAGRQGAADTAIWPLVTIMGRSLNRALWPPSTIETKTPVREGRFSYISYNLILQDRTRIRMSPLGIIVEPVP